MGPLIIDRFNKENRAVIKHELAILIATQRPRGWKSQLSSYITHVEKNSYYLLDLYKSLQNEYKYSFSSQSVLDDIEYLIRMAATKHVTGVKEPGPKLIQQTKSKIKSEIVPERKID
jgi:hypothetical protein